MGTVSNLAFWRGFIAWAAPGNVLAVLCHYWHSPPTPGNTLPLCLWALVFPTDTYLGSVEQAPKQYLDQVFTITDRQRIHIRTSRTHLIGRWYYINVYLISFSEILKNLDLCYLPSTDPLMNLVVGQSLNFIHQIAICKVSWLMFWMSYQSLTSLLLLKLNLSFNDTDEGCLIILHRLIRWDDVHSRAACIYLEAVICHFCILTVCDNQLLGMNSKPLKQAMQGHWKKRRWLVIYDSVNGSKSTVK